MKTTIDRGSFYQAIELTGLDEDDVKEGYSGKGMYGDSCIGIMGDLRDLISFITYYIPQADYVGQDIDWIVNARSDHLGLRTIWYWPGVQFEEEE